MSCFFILVNFIGGQTNLESCSIALLERTTVQRGKEGVRKELHTLAVLALFSNPQLTACAGHLNVRRESALCIYMFMCDE